MTENFPNLVEEKVGQVQEAQRPNRDEPQRDPHQDFAKQKPSTCIYLLSMGKGHIHVKAASDRPSPSLPLEKMGGPV